MSKHSLGIVAFCLMLLPLLGIEAQAQALKIGYTDHELIIQNMPEFQQIQQTLQQEAQAEDESLQAKFQEYQEKLDRYQKQQALLSEEKRAEREQELLQLQQEIQEAELASNQKLAERQAELLSPLFERVETAIQTVAKAKELDIVLRTQAGPMQPVILYVNEETVHDITMDVARELGLEVDEEPQTSSN